MATIQDINPPFHDLWIKDLENGTMDAFVMLLLLLVPNITHLRLTGNFARDNRLLGMNAGSFLLATLYAGILEPFNILLCIYVSIASSVYSVLSRLLPRERMHVDLRHMRCRLRQMLREALRVIDKMKDTYQMKQNQPKSLRLRSSYCVLPTLERKSS
jgi:hypothetical protein